MALTPPGGLIYRLSRRSDLLALSGGIAFSLAFTALIWWAGQRLDSIPHLPDYGADWYYWRLPEPNFWGRATAWTFYLLHQATLWGLIYYAKKRVRWYVAGLHPVNVVALAANAFFILLHFGQTHIWYDGLAQDVSIWTSLGSVVMLLIFILVMENPRRGMFFGREAPISRDVVRAIRSYHGFFFSWATIYTFWYHPMETTSGHWIGFLYMFLLLLQGSLFLTSIHVHRWWTLALEVTVLVHATLVALMQGNNLWPMFAFGFGGIFVITQMHGLSLPRWTRLLIMAIYAGAAAIVYTGLGWVRLSEIVRIPVIDYAGVFVIAWIVGGALWLVRRTGLRPAPGTRWNGP